MNLNPFSGLLDFMGKMGLTLKADPPRRIHTEGRQWGGEAEGILLSIREIPGRDPGEPPAISVIMKNAGAAALPLTIPGWIFFYSVETTAPLSAFGRQLLKPERRRETLEIVLSPGDATETDIPVGTMYAMGSSGDYPVAVSCTLPGGAVVRSNTIRIHV